MVVVMVGVHDRGQLDISAVDERFQSRDDILSVCWVDDDGFFRGFVPDEVGVVVALADGHGDRFDVHFAGGEGCLEL
jgi:hypothetical protein